MSLKIIFAIGIGGFFGAISRFLISTYLQKKFGTHFPIGTLSVNVIGSFIVGFLIIYFENIINPTIKAMAITGFLGSLTTFSTFSYETIFLLQNSLYYRAFLNIILNLILSFSATIAGMIIFKKMFGGVNV
ncbi:MAG TPA: fluoride efflux transporter CrcB [Campylobacterales bacterium]|nr:fluoride efflux transporter CrcB [Campylobacterales bacterium]